MVRKDGRKNFSETIANISKFENTSNRPLSEYSEHVAAAKDHIDGRLFRGVSETQSAFPDVAVIFSNEEIEVIRRGLPLTSGIVDKVMNLTDFTSSTIIKRHPCTQSNQRKNLITTHLFFDMHWLTIYIGWNG